jgi:hypothetical protein
MSKVVFTSCELVDRSYYPQKQSDPRSHTKQQSRIQVWAFLSAALPFPKQNLVRKQNFTGLSHELMRTKILLTRAGSRFDLQTQFVLL